MDPTNMNRHVEDYKTPRHAILLTADEVCHLILSLVYVDDAKRYMN